MKNYFFLIYLFLTLLFIQGFVCCKQILGDNCKLRIRNNTSKPILFYFSYNYPDTSIPNYEVNKVSLTWGINPNSEIHYCQKGFENAFSENAKGIIMFFIYDFETMNTIPLDTVRAKYLILKRYDLTLDSLKKLNWNVTYP